MQIKWSNDALEDWQEIEFYILKYFTFVEFNHFVDLFENILDNIISERVIYKKYQNTEFNIALISKQTSLIYFKDETELMLLRFISHVQDEDKKQIKRKKS